MASSKTASKIYNLLVIIESLILISCSLWGLFKFNFDEPIVTMTIIVGVYINIYLLWFSLNSLVHEDSLQMILSFFVHIFLTFISAYHYFKQPIHHDFNTALLIMCITTALCQVVFFVLTPMVICSFGNKIFESVGGDPQLQAMYKQGLIFFACLKMDLFLSILCLLLASARLVDSFWQRENLLNIASCIWNIAFLLCGYYIVKNERGRKFLLFWCLFGLIGQPFYIVYKTIQLWNDSYYSSNVYPTEVKIQFIVCGVIWLFVRAFVLIYSIVTIRANFGKGLADIWRNTSNYQLLAENERKKAENQHRIEEIRREALLSRQQRTHGDNVIYGIVPENYASQYQRPASPSINNNMRLDDDGAV